MTHRSPFQPLPFCDSHQPAPPSPSRQGCYQSILCQPVFVLGIALTHVQDLALGLIEVHEVRTGPPVKVPLDSIPPLQCVDCTTQLGVIGKLAEGALNATDHVTDKDVKQHQPEYQPPEECHWSPLGHRAIDCNSLSVAIQPIPYPPSGPPINSMSLQFRGKDVAQDSVKSFAQVQVDDVSCSSVSTNVVTLL